MIINILTILITVGLPLGLIYLFTYLDNEYTSVIKPKKYDIVIIITASLITASMMLLLNDNNSILINSAVLHGYLIFSSYTDQKTKLLYTSVSLIMIIVEASILVANIKYIEINELTWTIILIPIVIGIMSMFNLIGKGDWFIYVVISIYYTIYRTVPTISSIINILITNVLFIVSTLIIKYIKKDKDKKQPLTMYIAISTIICNTLMI